MKRFKHSLSHYRLLTSTFGELVPIGLVEALPGDTFQHSTSALVRVAPLIAPVMHPLQVRIHHWFVPHRLTMPTWGDFITGGSDGLGDGSSIPTLGAVTINKGDVLDYMGIPPATTSIGDLSALPVRAYNKIFNENYRDEDLVTEVAEDQTTTQKIAWGKDYFTSSRPWAQKGPAVTLPLGTSADVHHGAADATTISVYSDDNAGWRNMVASTSNLTAGTGVHAEADKLYADLTTATAATVNQIREAMALQRYQEARAQYGNRYTEYLRYCGIKPSDARLQRPEYLGGGKQTIAFSEVLNTSGTGTQGNLAGHGIAAMRSNRYRYFCEEHGYIVSLLSIRPMTMYMDGVARTWTKRAKTDFFQKELQLIGQQEIRNDEIYYQNLAADDDTFGYQDRYSEYRHEQSRVSGDFRDTLDHWHLGRQFGALPTLNASFIECDPDTRIFASAATDTFWIMASHSMQCRRMLTKKTIGRII